MNNDTPINNFSLVEETWHAITHGIGFGLGVAALVLLMVFSYLDERSVTTVVSLAIYGSTLIIMYGSSTLYHALKQGRAKEIFQRFDHSAIYFLIAGTYTPVMLAVIGGTEGWIIFGIEWAVAILGVGLKFIYPGRFELFSLIAYVAMGWLIVAVFDTFKSSIDPVGFWLIAAGGAAYTVGIIFYIKDNINYFHAILHLFVLAGSTLQFLAILLYVA